MPVFALVLATMPVVTRAQSPRREPIARAERQYLQADFASARSSFRAVLASRTLDRVQAAEAHRYLAAIELAFGRAPEARAHLEAALVLSRQIELPSGAEQLEPVVTEILAAMGPDSGLRIASIAPLAAGRPSRVVARLTPAPPLLGARITLRCGGDDTRSGAFPEVALTVTPSPGPLRCTAEITTSSGAVVLTSQRIFRVPAAIGPPIDRDERRDDASRLPVWPFVVGGGALVAIGVVVAIAVATSSGSDDAFVGRPVVDGW